MDVLKLLEDVKNDKVSLEEAAKELKQLPYEDLGFAKLDHHRQIRSGFGEVVFCSGKSDEHLLKIYETFYKTDTEAVSYTHLDVYKRQEYVRRLGGRFGYLHVIDNDGVSDSHILPGDGNMPLEGILREIRRAGYDGCATIELVTGYLKEPSVYAEIAIKRIRSIL